MLGTAGSGKTKAVRECIAERVKNGESGIVLLAPEQYTFESEKALLNLLGATAANKAEVMSFTKLVEYIGADLSSFAGTRADTGIKAVILKNALKSIKNELEVFSSTKPSPEFILSLLGIITELKQSNILPQSLESAAFSVNNKTFSKKLRDLSLIMSAYNAALAEKYVDPDDDLTRLNDALNDNHYFIGKTVFIDAFDGFTMQQYKIIEHIIKDSDDIFVSFCTDGVFDKEMGTGLFSNVKKEIARFMNIAKSNSVGIAKPIFFENSPRFKNVGISYVERAMRGEKVNNTDDCSGVTICEAETLYDEVDFTARTIKKLVRENGYRYRDFTVIVRNMDDYRHIFDSAFNRYSVPCYLDKRADNNDLMLVSYTYNILKATSMGFSQEYVLSFLKSPLSFMSIEEVSDLENYIFMWNVKGDSWFEEWKCNPDGMDAEFNNEKLIKINELRQKTVEFILPLKKTILGNETKKICAELYNSLVKADAPTKLKEYANSLKEDGNLFLADLQYKSWDFLSDLLDKIVTVLGAHTEPKELIETFEMLLKCDSLGTIPSRIDEVMIGDAYRIRPCDPKVVFVLGANYQEMPMPPSNSGLLTINDRSALINSGVEINNRAETDSIKERYAAYSSVCCASERVYITYHCFNKSNGQAMPSEFVIKLLKSINGIKLVYEKDSRMDRFESAASALEFLAENYDNIDCDFAELSDIGLKNSIGLIETARLGIDNYILQDVAKKLHGKDIYLSPSKLEQFSKCPFAYFCRYNIKAQPINKAQINSLQRGTIAHYVLEKLLKKYSVEINAIDDNKLCDEITDCVNEYINEHFVGFETDEKQFVFTIERIKKLLFDILRNIGEELSQTDFKPIMFEKRIAPDSDIKPISVDMDEGSVQVIGTVDRVDIMQKDGKAYVRVIDYKTGKKNFALSDILYGLNMQMLLYLYAFVESSKNINADYAGILYMPVRRADYIKAKSSEDNTNYTMNGLINSENAIPEAMERDGQGKFVPFKFGSNGAYKSDSLVTSTDFEDIKNKIMTVLRQTGERMIQGDIRRTPMIVDSYSVCDKCDYNTVCLSANQNTIAALHDKNAIETIRREVRGDEADKTAE